MLTDADREGLEVALRVYEELRPDMPRVRSVSIIQGALIDMRQRGATDALNSVLRVVCDILGQIKEQGDAD